jgi:hypothetical protein
VPERHQVVRARELADLIEAGRELKVNDDVH